MKTVENQQWLTALWAFLIFIDNVGPVATNEAPLTKWYSKFSCAWVLIQIYSPLENILIDKPFVEKKIIIYLLFIYYLFIIYLLSICYLFII